MDSFIYCTLIIYLSISIYKTYTWINSYFWIKKFENKKTYKNENLEKKELPYLVLLIPALREQSLVKETIEYFSKFNYPKENIKIFFITTEKEKYQKNNRQKEIDSFIINNLENPSLEKLEKTNNGLFSRYKLKAVLDVLSSKDISSQEKINDVNKIYSEIPLTVNLIEEKLNNIHKNKRDLFKLIHYPNKTGNKPEQLNYALMQINEFLEEKKLNGQDCYVGVYDFDARPDMRTGYMIAQEVIKAKTKEKKHPAMIQQVQIPFSNLNDFNEKGLHGMLMRGFATLYLRRALGIELFKIRKMCKVNKRRIPSILKAIFRPVTYGIGSGMFVNYDILNKIGGFPVPLEDLATGYRVSLLGEDIKPLPVFNMMEAYDSYNQMSNSGSICFLGAMRIWKDYLFIQSIDKDKKISKIEKLTLVAKEWVESSLWLIAIPVLLVTYCIAILYLKIDAVLLTLMVAPIILRSFVETAILQVVLTKICSNYCGKKLLGVNLNIKQKIQIILTSPVQGMVRIFAPIKAILRVIKIKVFKMNIEQKKTER